MAAYRVRMFVNISSTFKVGFLRTTLLSCHVPRVRYFSTSLKLFICKYYRPPAKYKKLKRVEISETEKQEKTVEETELDFLIRDRTMRTLCGHQVLVIQPFIKWGMMKKRNTTPELQLLESITLIKTLRQWKVVDQLTISLQQVHVKTVFGTGVLEDLRQRIAKNPQISAVFISLNALTIQQQLQLEKVFRVPVFDRFSIIMHIFKEHAQTKEAKLQIQLAQLPYLWTILREFSDDMNEKLGITANYLGGSGPKLLADRREVFKAREAKLKKEISELREQRAQLREKRAKQEIPVVAVIGYTNAGKTSLIKALTGKESLEPQDYLFATLDVTSHLGALPTGLKVYFTDTLGFISDVPTFLIESFVSTLEDAVLADVIIHVRDISHPDTVAQNDNVLSILKNINMSDVALENIITVGNKVDLVEKSELEKYRDLILVSSADMTGIDVLRQEVEKKILEVSNIVRIVVKVKSGGPEYYWLHKYSTVVKETPDEKNNQFTHVDIIITDVALAKFKHIFIKNHKE